MHAYLSNDTWQMLIPSCWQFPFACTLNLHLQSFWWACTPGRGVPGQDAAAAGANLEAGR